MGFGRLLFRFSGIELVVIILCDGIHMVKIIGTFTKGSFSINFLNTNLVGIDLLPCEIFFWVVTIGSIYIKLCKGKFSISIVGILWFPTNNGYIFSLIGIDLIWYVIFVVLPCITLLTIVRNYVTILFTPP